MSDSEEEEIEDQEESEEEEQEEEEEDEEEDGSDEEEDEDEDEDEDEEDDEDEDSDGDSNESGSGEEGSEEDESKENDDSQEVSKFVPTFKPVSEEFVFKNLLADIASIGNSVDHFISSLSSTGGSGYRSQPRSFIPEKSYEFKQITPIEEKKYTIMKDEDTQVSMQPQIVIQQTVVPQQEPKQEPYKMSNESTKFLSQLYEENKKLKRFQNSQTGGLGTNIWSKSQERFSRPEHERGLINLEDRNKEIDEAIEMLRREEYEN